MHNVVYIILSTLITMETLILTFYLHALHVYPKRFISIISVAIIAH